MKKLSYLLLASMLLAGCAINQKTPATPPPSVSTAAVVQSLSTTKSQLDQAGTSNTKVGQKIDKALTLADRLSVLIAQIEAEQAKAADKVVIPPTSK